MNDQPTLFDWFRAKKPRKMSQAERIADYLRLGHAITPFDALQMFGCFRLAARIFDLRKQGMNIVEENVTKDGATFAKYYLQ